MGRQQRSVSTPLSAARGSFRALQAFALILATLNILQLFAFTKMNGTTETEARSSIVSETIVGNNNTTPISHSQEQCITNIYDCDLSCLDWTIVLSTGRAGSTTIQQMVSKLPGMNFYGEEGGLLNKAQEFNQIVQNKSGDKSLAWAGASDSNVTALSCMMQKYYSERHGEKCLHRGCRHGWKEIRYRTKKDVDWVRTLFPSSRLVLNYRGLCQKKYKDKFDRNCNQIQKNNDVLLKAAGNLSNVFHMPLEKLSDRKKWHGLADFLGYSGCHAVNVTSANVNFGYTKQAEATKSNPWRCS